MPTGLRPGLSFCEASGHLVFLDIEADRYFSLARSAETSFRSLLRGSSGPALDRPVDEFLESGILVDGPDGLPLAPCPRPAPVRAALLDRPLRRAPSLAVALALSSFLRARFHLRLAGFATVLNSVTRRKLGPRREASDPAVIEAAAAAFHQCALLVRSHDQCLARSVALANWLAARGEEADLVIGVRVRPFAAHAWVQKDDLLLNESCDGVRGYTPILVA